MDTNASRPSLCTRRVAMGDWYGRTITARFLAERLRPYGIFSQNLRLLAGQKKGYTRASFVESWDRYLPAVPPSVPVVASRPSQPHPSRVPLSNTRRPLAVPVPSHSQLGPHRDELGRTRNQPKQQREQATGRRGRLRRHRQETAQKSPRRSRPYSKRSPTPRVVE